MTNNFVSTPKFKWTLLFTLFLIIASTISISLMGRSIPALASRQVNNIVNASAGSGSISGTVKGEEGVPLAGVRVKAYQFRFNTWLAEQESETDSAGNYTFDQLQVGLYRIGLIMSNGPYYTTFYGDVLYLGSATEVAVAGNRVENIDINAILPGEMSGTLTLNNLPAGYGYADVTLRLYEREFVNGDREFSFDAIQLQDGTYAIEGLLPGEYIACVSIRNRTQDDPSRFWLRECFGSTSSEPSGNFRDTEPLLIRSGALLPNIDFTLGNTTDSGLLSGQVTDKMGNPIEGVKVIAQSVVESIGGPFIEDRCYKRLSSAPVQLASRVSAFEYCTTTDATGQYTLSNIVAGRYVIGVEDSSGAYASTYYNNISGNSFEFDDAKVVELLPLAQVEGVNISLSMASRITGTVSVQGTGTAPSETTIRAYKITEDDALNVQQITVEQFTGGYEVIGLPAGTYSLTVVSHAYDDLGNVDARSVDVAEGATVPNVDFSLAEGFYNGVLQGQVTHNGIPLEGIRVEISQFESPYPAPIYFTETDDDGRYRIEGLGGEENYLSFVDTLTRYVTQFYNKVAGYRGAETITVDHNETVTIDVELEKNPDINGQVGVPTNLDVSQEPAAPETQWTDTIFMPFVRQ